MEWLDSHARALSDTRRIGILQVSELEIQQLFGSNPGFQQIKLNHGARGVTCFVEFTDVASAMSVHQQHQARAPASHTDTAEANPLTHLIIAHTSALMPKTDPHSPGDHTGCYPGIIQQRWHPDRVQQEPVGAEAGLWSIRSTCQQLRWRTSRRRPSGSSSCAARCSSV